MKTLIAVLLATIPFLANGSVEPSTHLMRRSILIEVSEDSNEIPGAKRTLDADAAYWCKPYGSRAQRRSEYSVVFGQTHHFSRNALISADYSCED